MRRARLVALVLAWPGIAAAGGLVSDPLVPNGAAAWSARPSQGQLDASKPPGVVSRAYVVLRCAAAVDGRLTDCATDLEAPVGRGLAAAALSLVAELRLEAGSARAIRNAGVKVAVEFSWSGDGGPCYPPDCIMSPPPPPPPGGLW